MKVVGGVWKSWVVCGSCRWCIQVQGRSISLHQIIHYLKDKIGVVFFRCCVIFKTSKGITHATAY